MSAEVGIDSGELEKLVSKLDTLEKDFPARRRDFVESVGRKLYQALRSRMGGGKVAGWQGVFYGSKGGWAAIRPHAKVYQETKTGKRYAVGYITGAIEGGHKVRDPSGTAKRYRPAIRVGRNVPGKYYYRDTRAGMEQMVLQEAQALVEQMAREV